MDTYGKDTAKIGTATFKVAKELKKFPLAKKSQGRLAPTFYMVVNNEEIMQQFLNEAYADSDMQVDWKEQHINIDYIVTFDLEGSQNGVHESGGNDQEPDRVRDHSVILRQPGTEPGRVLYAVRRPFVHRHLSGRHVPDGDCADYLL